MILRGFIHPPPSSSSLDYLYKSSQKVAVRRFFDLWCTITSAPVMKCLLQQTTEPP